jgi:alpha-N-arabinofuranosidase
MHKVKALVKASPSGQKIHPNLYGQFAEHLGRCIYEGLWVGEDSEIPNRRGIRQDVVDALRQLEIPVLRWPGGCFADEYHWKDGVGPRENRKRIYNSHWGGVVENNHFGTHEFFELCGQLGCKAYVCGNVGSGTVQEMSEWVEYMTSPAESPMAGWRRANGRAEPWRLDYFGIGNESWACGGHMRAEYYADEYRRYNTFVRTYGKLSTERIACGANVSDYHWTEVLMERAAPMMDGLSLHSYTLLDQQWPPSGSATEFGETEWYSILQAALAMDELISNHSAIMDRFDPDSKVGIVFDEWGTWYPVEPGTNPGFLYQQNTIRDALVASVHFNIFHKHARRLTMANIAQMVNVLQAMVLTDGPQMLLTPTYWAFEMYKVFQGAQVVDLTIESPDTHELPAITGTAARSADNLYVAFTNLDTTEEALIDLSGMREFESARILTAGQPNDHNTFQSPNKVRPTEFKAVRNSMAGLEIELPPKSILVITAK